MYLFCAKYDTCAKKNGTENSVFNLLLLQGLFSVDQNLRNVAIRVQVENGPAEESEVPRK